jgi:hypothetical protein
MINYLKSNVKLAVPYQSLTVDIAKEEIDNLLAYIKNPAVQYLLTPNSKGRTVFAESKYIRLANGCINPEENTDANWNSLFQHLGLDPNTERMEFYRNVRDLITPLATKMMTALVDYNKRQYYTHGVEINTLPPNTQIKSHIDDHRLVEETTRVHLVLETNNESYMTCNDEKRHFDQGECFIFNNLMWHSVQNNGASPRTHLVVDFLTIV